MWRLIFLAFVLFPATGFSQIWRETFETVANGATLDNGSTAWSTVQPSGPFPTFSKQYIAGLARHIFAINDTGGEGVWQSEEINISSSSEVSIEVEMGCYWTSSTDYIRCYYKLDGGPEVLFGELNGSTDLVITSAASAIVTGEHVEIVIRANENTAGTYGASPRMMGFDNITISNITYLYSRSSGNWGNVNTWSLTGYDGPSCNCTPDQNTHIFVGSDSNVNLNANVTSAGVTIENSGRINYTANAQLNIVRGGVLEIKGNGILDKNGNNSASLAFSTYNYNVHVDGNLSIGSLNINGAGVTLTGRGNIEVAGQVSVGSVTGKTISNGITGDFTIGGSLNFQSTSSNVVFLNPGNLHVSNRIFFDNDNVTLINSGSLTTGPGGIYVNNSTDDGNVIENSGSFNVEAINLNGGDFEIINTGLVNQSGDFLNVSFGSAFRNLSDGTWNFSGGGANTRLFTSNDANSFNYSGQGDQSVFNPADGAYHHLALSGSGVKTLAGNIVVDGDLLIDDASRLDVSTSSYDVDLAGDLTISSSSAEPFISRNGAMNFNGNSDQNLSSSQAVGFYNLSLDKPSGSVIIAPSPATSISVSGTLGLLAGGLDLNGSDLSIKNSSESAIYRANGFVKSESSSAPYSKLIWEIGPGAGTYIFPMGKSDAPDDFLPFTFDIKATGSGAGKVALATYATSMNNKPYPSGVTELKRNGQDNSNFVVDRFWQIDLQDYTSNPTADITFTATPDEVGAISQLRAQRWSGVSWDAPIEGQINNSLNSVTVPGVSSFSPWTLSGSSSTLPVELSYFQAVAKDGFVELMWETHQEVNNDFFSIERTRDFETFFAVAIVQGKGTTKERSSYILIDKEPFAGTSYYRLKQTDFDGNSEYFKPVIVEVNDEGKRFRIFPNPSDGDFVFFDLGGLQRSEKLFFEVTDTGGKVVYSQFLSASQHNEIKFEKPLLPGIYFVRIGPNYSKLLVQ